MFDFDRAAELETLEAEGCRIASLLALDILDTEPEPEFDALVRLAATFCDTPIAMLSFVDTHRQFFKARVGIDAIETPRLGSFCEHAILQPHVALIVPDAAKDHRFHDSPFVVGEPHVRFYAGVPLVTSSGDAVGTLCIIDRVPRELTPVQLQALSFAAKAVMALLERRHESARLRMLELVSAHGSDGVAIIAVGVVPGAHRVEYLNQGFTTLTGYDQADASDAAFSRALGELAEIETVSSDGAVVRDNVTLLHKDGTPTQFDMMFSPIVTPETGRVSHVVAVLRNTNSQQMLEMELERGLLAEANESLERDLLERHIALGESQRQFAALADAMPLIVCTTDADGAIDFANQRWYEYSGMTFGQTRGVGWQTAVHPADVEDVILKFKSALQARRPFEAELRLRRAGDGEYRWQAVRAAPVGVDDVRATKWFVTSTDIDDLKIASEAAGRLTEQVRLNEKLEYDLRARERAEAALRSSDERFRQVEEHAPIGLALVSLDGAFFRVNPALCAITGYTREALLATTYQKLTHPEDLAPSAAYINAMLSGTISSYSVEGRYLLGERIVWISLHCSLVRDERGEPSYFIQQIEGIGQRKASEEALEIARIASLAAVEAKSRFVATMSHEIRTPMSGIIGMAELLGLSSLDQEQMECLGVVRDSGRSLLRVVDDILDYSKIEAGKLEYEICDFSISHNVVSVVSLMGPQYDSKGVALHVQIGAEVPVVVQGDAGRVRQILINLVGNALKFTPVGGNVRIVVTSAPGDDTVHAIRFSITDSGPGVAHDLRHRLFQPFSQLDGSTTRRHGGTGLGLAICKQLAELMGGSIGIETSPESGSTFWFSLPFVRSDAARSVDPVALLEQRQPQTPAVHRHEKLLLAEDNDVNVLLAVKQFKRLGFNITVVPNGKEAVKAFRDGEFDAVFMDCHMPEMDGFEATRAIRSLPARSTEPTPIIAMTANAQADDRDACLAAGMNDFISKPASLLDVQAVLARWLPATPTP